MRQLATPRLDVEVVILEPRWLAALPRARALVRRAASATIGVVRPRLPRAGTTLAVALASDQRVQALNRDHRGQDRPTNVLSYPAAVTARRGEPCALGDVVLALRTVQKEARAQRKPLAHHLSHLVVHGTLHLLGYDHLQDPEAQAMEALEAKILAGIGVPNPYLGR